MKATVKREFPLTPATLLTRLREPGDGYSWEVSWKRFLELYQEPLILVARACYRHHNGGHDPSPEFVEDVVATVVAGFFMREQHRFDAERGRLRTYLRVLVNARVVDALRRSGPVAQSTTGTAEPTILPDEGEAEREAFHRAFLATLVEDLRNEIPLRQFEIFERVKLKQQSPKAVAEDIGLHRAAIDRSIYKTMTKLREIARRREYQEEFYP